MGAWFVKYRRVVDCSAAAAVGAIGWSGQVATLSLSFAFPLLYLIQPNRRAAYGLAFAYYAGASWPLVSGASSFFGPNHSYWQAVGLWIGASLLLAAPWGLFHFPTWPLRWLSLPLAFAGITLPPVGLIGWASPLTSAGILFPASGWLGILGLVLLPAVVIRRARGGILAAGAFVALANLLHPGFPRPPSGWEAVDTTFGGSELERTNPLREFQQQEWIQQRALASAARVIVFPETALAQWTEATEEFWEPTVTALTARDQTVFVGATVAIPASSQRLNNVIIRGAAGPTAFSQRIPPPISMWRPLSRAGFPVQLNSPATLQIGGERVGVLICYELLVAGPVLSTTWEHPTLLVGVANDYWVRKTPIPAVQHAALLAWARLYWLPSLIAANN
jgi:hypothetical protein